MPELSFLYDLLQTLLPFEIMQMRFMQQALLGLLLLAPMVALMGVQVVNFRMAFFADAISHSAFTGVALGLIFSVSPLWAMPIFALLVGLAIVAGQRRSNLPGDTVIGVFFSGIVAFGLAVVSRDKNVARDIQRFLYGDILGIGETDLWLMLALLVVLVSFQIYGYNRMLYIGVNPLLAKVHRVRVAAYQYLYAALLSLVVILSVRAVGVLLVTAMPGETEDGGEITMRVPMAVRSDERKDIATITRGAVDPQARPFTIQLDLQTATWTAQHIANDEFAVCHLARRK